MFGGGLNPPRKKAWGPGGSVHGKMDGALTSTGGKRPRPHGEKTPREKLKKKGLRGRFEAFPVHRNGFVDIRRTEARSLRLVTPRERRRCASAAHLHLNSAPRAVVHGSKVPGTLRGRPETLRRRSRIGQEPAGRRCAASRGKQRQCEIQNQDTKEHRGGEARPRPQMIPVYGVSVPHESVSFRGFRWCNTIHRPRGKCKAEDSFFPNGRAIFRKIRRARVEKNGARAILIIEARFPLQGRRA